MARRDPVTESPAERGYRRELIAGLVFEVVPISTAAGAVAALPPGSTVSVTCSPVKGITATQALAEQILAAGHRPVPHLAARMVDGPEQVRQLATWLRAKGIDQIFVVGGDAEHAAGPYPDGASFLWALLEADPGLTAVGVPAYPDGHPLIDAVVLNQALAAKQALLAEAGLTGYASTQMCFDPDRIAAWLVRARADGVTLPVHLGVPGVVERAKLMTMGVRLGVGASLRYLRKNRAAMGSLLTSAHYDPNRLLEPLSRSLEPLGITGIHCFTFNQVAATAAWQAQALSVLS